MNIKINFIKGIIIILDKRIFIYFNCYKNNKNISKNINKYILMLKISKQFGLIK